MSNKTGAGLPPGEFTHSEAVPWARQVIEPIVAPHLARFSKVLTQAWEGFQAARDLPGSRIGEVQASCRGMLVSDLARLPALQVFGDVPGARVVQRCGQPWVHLAGDQVQVRFRKLKPTLAILPGQSDRAQRLAWHLPDPMLQVPVVEATVLTAGYVLDSSELRVEQMALVCHLGFDQVHYFIPLPGGAVAKPPKQLTLTPLSAPIIRSARAAVAKRLAKESNSS